MQPEVACISNAVFFFFSGSFLQIGEDWMKFLGEEVKIILPKIQNSRAASEADKGMTNSDGSVLIQSSYKKKNPIKLKWKRNISSWVSSRMLNYLGVYILMNPVAARVRIKMPVCLHKCWLIWGKDYEKYDCLHKSCHFSQMKINWKQSQSQCSVQSGAERAHVNVTDRSRCLLSVARSLWGEQKLGWHRNK